MEKVITLNDIDFLVVKELTYNETNYIYAIATDGTDKLALVKESIENGETFVESVIDETEFNEVMKLMAN